METTTQKIKKLERGDVIKRLMGPTTERSRSSYLYHFGIYTGDDTVIHFSDKIYKSSLKDFTGGKKVSRETYDNAYTPEKIAERAEDYYKNPKRWGNYQLMLNNCENFATCCATGISKSEQAEKVAAYVVRPIPVESFFNYSNYN